MERTIVIRFREPRRAEPSGRGIARDAAALSADGVLWNPPCLRHEWGFMSGELSIRPEGPAEPGKYQALYQYLEHRYADTVVLTFAQIEDLLGFPLPDSARVHQEWWANTDPKDPSQPHSRSWTLASRTATPNLRAQTVVFERAQHGHRR